MQAHLLTVAAVTGGAAVAVVVAAVAVVVAAVAVVVTAVAAAAVAAVAAVAVAVAAAAAAGGAGGAGGAGVAVVVTAVAVTAVAVTGGAGVAVVDAEVVIRGHCQSRTSNTALLEAGAGAVVVEIAGPRAIALVRHGLASLGVVLSLLLLAGLDARRNDHVGSAIVQQFDDALRAGQQAVVVLQRHHVELL